MKTKSLFLSFFLLLIMSVSARAQVVTANIKVYGNCSMCKKRIETALERTGIKKATWDPKTKILQVVYNRAKVNENDISKWVAAAGHDTDGIKAADEAYASLPYCCLYRDHGPQHDPQ